MDTFPLLTRLEESSDTILLAGAGGGYDVFCALPLFFKLRAMGKEVILGNLSFSQIDLMEGARLTNEILEVTAQTPMAGGSYFPEKFLCEWLDLQLGSSSASIFCFERTGVAPICDAYEALVAEYEVDTVILMDGGTDSLMRGDEFGLGTPQEDIASIAAASRLEIANKYLVCIGFGIDTFHGVNHCQFLEAVADLTKAGAFLGGGPLLKESEEAQLYREATDYVFERMSNHPSIVNSSVLAAVDGEYGDFHATHRDGGEQAVDQPADDALLGLRTRRRRRTMPLPRQSLGDEVLHPVDAGDRTVPRRAGAHQTVGRHPGLASAILPRQRLGHSVNQHWSRS